MLQSLGMHWPECQKVRVQGHVIIVAGVGVCMSIGLLEFSRFFGVRNFYVLRLKSEIQLPHLLLQGCVDFDTFASIFVGLFDFIFY